MLSSGWSCTTRTRNARSWIPWARGRRPCDQLEKAVADCRRQFKERASKAKEELKKAVSERRMLLQEKQGRLASHVQLTQRVQGMGVCEEKVQMRQALEAQVDCSLRTCEVPQDLKGSNSPLIVVNSDILHFIKTAIGIVDYVIPPSLSENWEEVVNFIKNTPSKFVKTRSCFLQNWSHHHFNPPESPSSEVLSELDTPQSLVSKVS
ncbi:uncharacterized protein LOC112557641 [Pomacea canaliculata]|uniref:uncharacterized protein LOC112557641 n=1 Tax=Pomacea canaliculata TaxID=400727 RepID=UPI000D73DFC0|nr:uncharacterized protein LOC112557641 [Pomacea canaliculata]